MIFGIGCDLIEIERIKNSCQSERFMSRCFSPAELSGFAGDFTRLAGCFAAKEGFAKALGTGVRGFSLCEVSALRDALGKPYFVFEGRALEKVLNAGVTAHLSLSNTKTYAMAMVVLEVNEI